jgi:hypothetical protein
LYIYLCSLVHIFFDFLSELTRCNFENGIIYLVDDIEDNQLDLLFFGEGDGICQWYLLNKWIIPVRFGAVEASKSMVYAR